MASNMFTDLNLTDMETCYKAFRREVLESFTLEEDRFGIEPEITAKVRGRSLAGLRGRHLLRRPHYDEGKKIGLAYGVPLDVVRSSAAHRSAIVCGDAGRARRARPGREMNLDEPLRKDETTTLHWADSREGDPQGRRRAVRQQRVRAALPRDRRGGADRRRQRARAAARAVPAARRAAGARDARPLGPHPGRAGDPRSRLRGRRSPRSTRRCSRTSATTCSSTTPR